MSTKTIPAAYIYRCDCCETPYRSQSPQGSGIPPEWGTVALETRDDGGYRKIEWLVCPRCLESIRGGVSETLMRWGKDVRKQP